MLLAGCLGQVDPYPAGWRPLNGATDCASLLGTYVNDGERSGAMASTLFQLLVSVYDGDRKRPLLRRPVRAITLSMPEPDVLEARGEGVGQRFVAARGDFACRQGAIEFSRAGSGAGNVGASAGSETVWLFQDAEGTLVVRQEVRGAALLGFVVPAAVRAVSWYRFRAVSASP